MAENKTEFSDFNWGFATLGTLHQKGKFQVEALICPKIVDFVLKSYKLQNFQHELLRSQSDCRFW